MHNKQPLAHEDSWAMGVTHLCSCGSGRTHVHTHIHTDIYPHTCFLMSAPTSKQSHICPSTLVCQHLPLTMPPSYLSGLTDNSGSLPNSYITELWAASQAGVPLGYHDTSSHRGTEIPEHRQMVERHRNFVNFTPQPHLLSIRRMRSSIAMWVPFTDCCARPAR